MTTPEMTDAETAAVIDALNRISARAPQTVDSFSKLTDTINRLSATFAAMLADITPVRPTIDQFLQDRIDEHNNLDAIYRDPDPHAALETLDTLHAALAHRANDTTGRVCTMCSRHAVRVPYPCPTLRRAVAMFDDHDDYNPDWAIFRR